jgi:hypothetical protein
MSGLSVREQSRAALLAALRAERWGQVISVSEALLVLRRRALLAERVTARRVPAVRAGGLR